MQKLWSLKMKIVTHYEERNGEKVETQKELTYREILLHIHNYPQFVVDAMTDEECEGEYEVITTSKQ